MKTLQSDSCSFWCCKIRYREILFPCLFNTKEWNNHPEPTSLRVNSYCFNFYAIWWVDELWFKIFKKYVYCNKNYVLILQFSIKIDVSCKKKICWPQEYLFFSLFFFLRNSRSYWLIDWLIAVLGVRFCVRAFSTCGKWGPLFITVCRPLTIAASLVTEHRLQTRRLSNLWLTGPVAPWHVGSSQTRARTRVPCIGRQILNHCATREAPRISFIFVFSLAFHWFTLKMKANVCIF